MYSWGKGRFRIVTENHVATPYVESVNEICVISFVATGRETAFHVDIEDLNDTIIPHAIKDIRAYKITDTEYNKLSSMTFNEVDKKYPYVEDYRSIVNPYLECNENLLHNAVLGWYSNNNNEITGEGNNENWGHYGVGKWIPIKPSTTYTLLNPFNKQALVIFKDREQKEGISSEWRVWGENITLTSGENSVAVQVLFANLSKEEVEMFRTKVTFVEGTLPKEYEKCHNSRIMFETKLYEGEKISRRNDGIYIKNSIYQDTPIETMSVASIPSGYKSMIYYASSQELTGKLVCYDGNVIDLRYLENKYFNLMLPNSLTGWEDNYIPTDQEIRAFFLGWRMRSDNGEEGQKSWDKLWSGIGESMELLGTKVVTGSNTTECPIIMNDQGYTPYHLIYKKINPTIEEIKTYGELIIKKDVDINSGSGLIIGEKVTPFLANGKNYIGGTNIYNKSNVSCRINNIIKVYDSLGNIINFNFMGRATRVGKLIGGRGQATYNTISNNDFVDYLIERIDTVTSYDYSLIKPITLKETLNKTVESIGDIYEELAKTKKELEYAKYELSQRSNPNLLINGDFQVWQRGLISSMNGSTRYHVDRWSDASISGTAPIVKKGENSGCVINFTVDSDRNTRFHQYIEEGYKYNGKTVTLSLKVRSLDIPKRKIGISISSTPIFSKTFNTCELEITNFFKIYTFTTHIPKGSMSFGDTLNVVFGLSTHVGNYHGLTSVYTAPIGAIEFDWVKLEIGECATPFVPRSYAEELRDCQRYYWRNPHDNTMSWFNGYSILGGGFRVPIPKILDMRKQPTVIFDQGEVEVFTENGWESLKFTGVNNDLIFENTSSNGALERGRTYLVRNIPSLEAEIY